jgi:predicted HicB family RNase H-like nuclease
MMDGMQNNQFGQQAGQEVSRQASQQVEPLVGQAPMTEAPMTEAPVASEPVTAVSQTISIPVTGTLEERKREAVHMALEMARQVSDWETFFRGMLGTGGVIEQLFPGREQRSAFKQMPEYHEIQRIMARLRDQLNKRSRPDREVTRVITVRLPESLHHALMAEAGDMKTSMNKLCISKLLQVIDDDLVC